MSPEFDVARLEELGAVVLAGAADFGWRVLVALAIFVVGRIGAGIVRRLVERGLGRYRVEQTLARFLGNVVYALLLAAVVVAAIGRLGVETTSLVAIVGAAGLAVGLALQGSLSNFAAGVLIVFFQPYKVGDYIEAGGTAGTVREVQIFTTVLHTPDNKRVIVPNSQIMGGTIVNYSANDTRRVDLVASCSYGDDLSRVAEILAAIVRDDERVLDDPAPTVAVSALGESSVDFVVRPWVRTPDYWAVYFALTEEIKRRFDAAGISIPFPQRDVHVVHATQ